MEPLTPSSRPIAGAELPGVAWEEYKRLYERYLELYARSVQQGEEWNRLLAEHFRQEKDQAARHATAQQWWVTAIVLFCAIGVLTVLFLDKVLKWWPLT
jgi:hypothetical protein